MAYKVEDLTFFNMKKFDIWVSNPYRSNGLTVFEIEKTLTEAEKIAFMDEMKDGLASYLLHIITKWEKEKDDLPQDQMGRPKTVSKKAWIKRNDPRGIVDLDYKIGRYRAFGNTFTSLSLECPTTENGYSLEHTGKFVVHQWFHDVCEQLYREEKKYFADHDPFEIKLKQVKEYGDYYGCLFDDKLLNDIVWNREKNVKEERLDQYIEAYETLENHIQAITKTLAMKVNDEETSK